MENIEFNPGDQKYKTEADFGRPKESAMVKLIMKLSGGTIRDEKQANYVLLGIATLFFIATFFVISGTFGGPKGATIQYREDIPEKVRATMPPEEYSSLPSRADEQ